LLLLCCFCCVVCGRMVEAWVHIMLMACSSELIKKIDTNLF
jgi:hypothetical protein